MGEGLQHQDGHSLLLAPTIPACEAYDPAFAFELGAIIEEGLDRMYPDGSIDGEDVFYYITVYENYEQPSQPDHVDNRDITSGLYKFYDGPDLGDDAHRATLLFSGPSYLAAKEAQTILAEQYNVAAEHVEVIYKRPARTPSTFSDGTGSTHSGSVSSRWLRPSCRAARGRSSPYRTGWPCGRPDQPLDPSPHVGARHRRLRPVRYARRTAVVLRGRRCPCCGHRAQLAGETVRSDARSSPTPSRRSVST